MEEDPPRHLARYSPGQVTSLPDGRLFSPSFERNHGPIAEAVGPYLTGQTGRVLEIGSGTGQHAAFFAGAFAPLEWQPTDVPDNHLASIEAWRQAAGHSGMLPALRLDASAPWPAEVLAARPYAAVYSMNVIHIAPWAVAEGIVAGAAKVLDQGAPLLFYGPFREGGTHTGEGNAKFDASLRADHPDWGVRNLEDLADCAGKAGFGPPEIARLPANNLLVGFRRS